MQAKLLFPKRLLILDDDRILLEILSEYLSSAGFSIKTIEKPGDFFNAVTNFKPDLVVLDYLLDGINGGELCHQLKNSKKSSHIQVIIYSAFFSKVLLSLGTYGCDEFIAKPFDLDLFVNKITELLAADTAPMFSAI